MNSWLVWLSLTLAATPSWVKELDGRTEVCAVPVEGDPDTAEPPPLSPLQQLRRDRAVPATGVLAPPSLLSFSPQDPVGVSILAAEHPVKKGWSLVRVQVATPPTDAIIEQHITIAVDTTDSMSSATLYGVPLLQDEPPPERGSYRSVNRVNLAKESLHELVDLLEGESRTVAIVAFREGTAVELAPPTPVSDKATLHAAIARIDAKNVGDEELFETLFRTAAKAFTACADDRILMLTDDNPRFQGDPADVREGLSAWAGQGLRLYTFAVAATNDLTPITRLTVAGGGTLRRADTVGELQAGYVRALRPTGAVLQDASVEVVFPGTWDRPGGAAEGRVHRWGVEEVWPSQFVHAELYEVEGSGPVKVNLSVTPLLIEGGPRKASLASAAPVSWADAPAPLRHEASFLLAEAALRGNADMPETIRALDEGVKEVGPGREAQALLHLVK